jgi:hypothetical protein
MSKTSRSSQLAVGWVLLRPVRIGDGGFQPQALIVRKAVEDVNKLEPFGAFRPIYRGPIHQVVEIRGIARRRSPPPLLA